MNAAGPRLALGLLTVVPTRVGQVDRSTAGAAILLAPAVGLGLGLVAAVVAGLALELWNGALLAAILAVAALAVLTGALHLDGLADTADGLGSRRPAAEAMEVMRASDIGPFGVVTLILVLLTQVAVVTQLLALGVEPAVLLIPVVVGRLALVWACRAGVPAARPSGLGALVAGTVTRPGVALASLAGLAVAGVVAAGTSVGLVSALLAVGAGVGAAELLLRYCVRRLGGVTGDVLGALVEVATTTALLVLAA